MRLLHRKHAATAKCRETPSWSTEIIVKVIFNVAENIF